MATATIYLDGDVQVGWNTSTGANHYGAINEGTAAPNDSTYIEVTTPDAVDEWSFGPVPANVDTVTQWDFKVRGRITDSSAASYYSVELWHTGGAVKVGAT